MAQVSPTTVSFVLNGKAREKRISPEVIRRVEKLVTKMEYKPNQMARGLRTGETKTIGLMVEDISNHFFATLAKAIEDEANCYGYEVLFCSTEDKDERAEKLLQMLKYRQVDGFVLTPTASLEHGIQALLKENKSVVLIDRYFPSLKTHYVMVDNFKGAYMATQHMLQQGYKKLAIITTTSRQMQMEQRRKGYKTALKDGKIKYHPDYELSIPFGKNRDQAIKEIKKFLEITRPDAVFFSTNYLGIFGLEAIKVLKWKIPGQIGVVIFDDHAIFRLYTPAITCVAQPMKKMGACVIKALMSGIKEQRGEKYLQFDLEPELIIRESCGEKNKGSRLNTAYPVSENEGV